MDKTLQAGDRALLWLNGWGGITKTEVKVVGQTPKRYRIEAIKDRTKLAGRSRFINTGETALVPKRALTKIVK